MNGLRLYAGIGLDYGVVAHFVVCPWRQKWPMGFHLWDIEWCKGCPFFCMIGPTRVYCWYEMRN
jgi:hypothetical protein